MRSPRSGLINLVREAKSAGTGARSSEGEASPSNVACLPAWVRSMVVVSGHPSRGNKGGTIRWYRPSEAPFQDSGVFMSRVPPEKENNNTGGLCSVSSDLRLALLGFAEGLARQRLKSRGGLIRMCFSQDKTQSVAVLERST